MKLRPPAVREHKIRDQLSGCRKLAANVQECALRVLTKRGDGHDATTIISCDNRRRKPKSNVNRSRNHPFSEDELLPPSAVRPGILNL
jgi:hypothetical protein